MNKELEMQMKKFTTEDIRSAMIYCRDFDNCNINCPFNNKEVDCASIISNYALDISNRQKAEIERHKTAVKKLMEKHKLYKQNMDATREDQLQQAKAEAMKEFAERLLDECLEYPLLDGDLTILVNRRDFDRLVKEVTEEIYNE